MAVSGELHAVREPGGQVAHEHLSVLAVAATEPPRRHELGVRADGGPHPQVAVAELALMLGGDVFGLGVAERPNLVALDARARQVGQRAVLVPRARNRPTWSSRVESWPSQTDPLPARLFAGYVPEILLHTSTRLGTRNRSSVTILALTAETCSIRSRRRCAAHGPAGGATAPSSAILSCTGETATRCR